VIEITLARSRLLSSHWFQLLLAVPAVERKETNGRATQKLKHGELGSPDVGFWEIYLEDRTALRLRLPWSTTV